MNVDNHNSPHAQFRSLPLGTIKLLSGFWYQRQLLNRDVGLKNGYRKLQQHGNFDNLKLAIGSINGEFKGPKFMDSDVYKWLEAAAYELIRNMDKNLLGMVNETIFTIRGSTAT